MKSRAQRYRYVRHVVSGTRPSPWSPLSLGLAAYWQLGEVSGDASDSGPNGMTLTDHAGVSQANGVGAGQKARAFAAASSQYLSHADNAVLRTGDIDFTFLAWVRPTDILGYYGIVSKGRPVIAGGEFEAYIDPTIGQVFWRTRRSDDSNEDILVSTGNLSAGAFSLVELFHDSTLDQTGIRLDNGTADTMSAPLGVRSGTNEFTIGTSDSLYMNGRIQAFGFWKRLLTSDERAWLYNGGAAARTYAELLAYTG